MKALFIRVGIDIHYGSPSAVYKDGSFLYIPIYNEDVKEIETKEKRTYLDLNEKIRKYLPEKYHNKIIHLDPEFETFTYGDPARNKRNKLLQLEKGDLLIFYMGGRLQDDSRELGCFIFACFVVDTIIDWNKLNEKEKSIVEIEFKNNAHIRSSKSKNNLVLIKGNKRSKMLSKCIKITEKNPNSNNPPYLTSLKHQNFLGLRANITRAIPILIEKNIYIKNIKKLLNY